MIQEIKTEQETPLRLILPKKGRLKEDFTDIIHECPWQAIQAGDRLDYGTLTDVKDDLPPVEILKQRAADAIDNLNLGIADMAIVGLDSYQEKRCEAALRDETLNTRIISSFNVSACGLYIAAPQNNGINSPSELSGKKIITSYPNALRKWLDDQGIQDVKIITRDGGIEDYIRLGVADMICDIVDTGSTLKANGLKPCLKLFDSKAVLIQRTGEWSDAKATLAEKIKNRFATAQQPSKSIKQTPLTAPEKQTATPLAL